MIKSSYLLFYLDAEINDTNYINNQVHYLHPTLNSKHMQKQYYFTHCVFFFNHSIIKFISIQQSTLYFQYKISSTEFIFQILNIQDFMSSFRTNFQIFIFNIKISYLKILFYCSTITYHFQHSTFVLQHKTPNVQNLKI